jgi:aminoglycoside phosphotransferase (APT) family kinase protein
MRRDFPPSGSDDEAQRLVVFKVINLKLKGEVCGTDCKSRRSRPSRARDVDLAKRVSQVHAVDAAGHVLVSRALARDKFIA